MSSPIRIPFLCLLLTIGATLRAEDAPPPPAAASVVELAASAAQAVSGQTIELVATLRGPAPAAGDVVFRDGPAVLGRGPIAAGGARLAIANLGVGDHLITATLGDAAGAPASAPLAVRIAPAATSLQLALPAVSSLVGAPLALTATLSVTAPGAGTPTGTVTFLAGTGELGSAPLVAGTASLTIANLPPGEHQLTVRYAGDAAFAPSAAPATGHRVDRHPTTIALATSATPVPFGQAPTITATVTSADGIPDGEVVLMLGERALGTIVLAAGSGSLAVPGLEGGTHALTARFAGSARHAASAAPALEQRVTAAPTTVGVALPDAAVVHGQPLALVGRIAWAGGLGGIPGTLDFHDGGERLGSAPLADGVATLAVPGLAAGEHRITATYGGSASFAAGASPAVALNVAKAGTGTVLVPSVPATVVGQELVLTATVATPAPGRGPATGEVVFRDGDLTLGKATLAEGVATWRGHTLPVGAHSFTAAYQGDAGHAASAAAPLALTTSPATTTLALVSSAERAKVGQELTLVATLAVVAPGTGVAGGTVRFLTGTTPIGEAPASGGKASLTISTLEAGAHVVHAQYQGDGSYAPSASPPLTQRIELPTSLVLAASTTRAVAGQQVALTATLATPSKSRHASTGSVTFKNGASVLGSAPLEDGRAVLLASSLGVGEHRLVAMYPGDERHTASTSADLEVRTAQALTVTTIGSSANPVAFGTPVTLVAVVRVIPPGTGQPTGTVNFLDGTNLIGTASLTGGKASLTTTYLAVGSHGITAQYSGDRDYAGAAVSFFTQMVGR